MLNSVVFSLVTSVSGVQKRRGRRTTYFCVPCQPQRVQAYVAEGFAEG